MWLLVVPINGSLGPSFPDLVKDLGLLALGLAAYGAVFAVAGAVLKRPLLIGLIYVLGWEPLVMAIPGYLKRLSVAYYVQGRCRRRCRGTRHSRSFRNYFASFRA